MKKDSKIQKSRGIYLLPNLFTTAGLFFAFYAIVSAMKGRFDMAAIGIFIAMIADLIDGRVARLINAQSAFGAEYDSLSDMVSFGVAPALVVYSSSLYTLGKVGWLISFLYTAAAALRLARFNTQIETADKRYFQGLSSPSAAAIVASIVWIGEDFAVNHEVLTIVSAILTLFAALMMVSNVRYHSFKEIDFKGKVSFVAILIVVLVFVGVSINPPLVLFIGFFSYAMSGIVVTLWQLRKSRSK